jgi:lipopolysaccharide export system permease protein
MKILDWYLSKQVALFFMILLLVLSGLAWMLQILSMLRILIQYNVSVSGFLGLTAMMLPFIAALIFPFAIFIAAMFILNRLIADREVTVIMGAGLSPAKIARMPILIACLLGIIHFAMNVWIVPSTQDKFYKTQWEMRYGLAHLALQESSFNQLTDNLVAYVSKVSDHDISQLMLFDNRNPKNQMVALAEKGKLIATARGMSIVMTNGSIQSRGDSLVIGTFDSYDMDMNVSDKQVTHSFKVRRLSTEQLIKDALHSENLKKSERKSLMSEIANRFLMPFMDILLVLIAAAVLLKMSLLRRRISVAAPIAVFLMGISMAMFMTFSGIIGSFSEIAILAGGIFAAIIGTFLMLIKRR